jgi:hypothetical protein
MNRFTLVAHDAKTLVEIEIDALDDHWIVVGT